MDAISIRIDNRLRLSHAELGSDVAAELRERCTYDNPGRRKMEQILRGARGKKRAALSFALKNEPAQVETWADDGDDLTLPRGALGKVREVLTARGLAWRYEDTRGRGDPRLAPPRLVHRPDPRAEGGGALRWYQAAAMEACIARQNCLLRAPTGSGKTSTLIAIVAALGLPSLVVVDSTELMRQWVGRLSAELGLDEDDIGIVGGGTFRLAPVTVGMRQSLMKRAAALRRTFGVVIVDEVHRAAATTFMGVVDAFASKYRIGASADETRADGKEFLVYDVFGSVAHEVTRDTLITDGSVLDVECRVIPTEFRADWYVHQREVTGSPDFNKLLDELTVDPARNALIEQAVRAEAEAGEQVIALSHRVEHVLAIVGAQVQAGRRAEPMLGGVEWAERRAAAIDAMRTGSLHIGAGTIQSIGTGLDLPSVGRGVLATPVGANRQLYGQIRGRLCRPGAGKNAVIYVLWDQHVSGAAPLKRMVEWNRSVVVRDAAGLWVDGRAYLKRWKDEHHGT